MEFISDAYSAYRDRIGKHLLPAWEHLDYEQRQLLLAIWRAAHDQCAEVAASHAQGNLNDEESTDVAVRIYKQISVYSQMSGQ